MRRGHQKQGFVEKLSGMLGLAQQAQQMQLMPRQANARASLEEAQAADVPKQRAASDKVAEGRMLGEVAPTADMTRDPAIRKRLFDAMGIDAATNADVDPMEAIEKTHPGVGAILKKLFGGLEGK